MTSKRKFATAIALLGSLSLATASRAATFRIEIDYMVGTHSHQPSAAVIAAVQQMFACQGHTLIVDVSNAVTHYNVLQRNPANCGQSLFSYSGLPNSFGAIKAANFNHVGASPAWHYCIFAHNYEDSSCNTTGSSGLAEGVDDFVVTLGSFSGGTGTTFDQAATLAHEFGHNLGLSHCGNMNCPTNTDNGDPDWVGPYVPNMPSIMSYRYQLAGVQFNMLCNGLTFDEALFKNIDYSHGRMCALNENSLNEIAGTQMQSTDWDCDGTLEAAVAQDINGTNAGWCGSLGNRSTLNDYNEWANIDDGANLVGRSLEDRLRRPETPCITAEEWESVRNDLSQRGSCGQPALATESCISGENMYIGTFFLAEIGTCVLPYDSVIQAQAAAPNNSVYYIKPGTYDETNNSLLNKPGKYFCNTGTAIIR